MERRKFIIGLGSAAAGSTALVGSGAFAQGTLDRESTADVVADGSSSLLGIESQTDSDIVRVDDDSGELTIDGTVDGEATGFNVNSEWLFGGLTNSELRPGQSDYNPAVEFYNNDSEARRITWEYELDDDSGDSEITFAFGKSAHPSGVDKGEYFVNEGSHSIAWFDPGQVATMGFEVDTTEGSTGDDLSGTLTITLEPM
ncbi:hypothetical protein ACFQGT_18190 [Natrialbaceae archaeon GCM10025810]|uniref:hypothetical protein n=1 Tax=Halovalidus salilacus TaxID=3075124 RepID=UPI003615DBEC